MRLLEAIMQKKLSILPVLSFLLIVFVGFSMALEKPGNDGTALSAPPKTATRDVKEIVQGTESP